MRNLDQPNKKMTLIVELQDDVPVCSVKIEGMPTIMESLKSVGYAKIILERRLLDLFKQIPHEFQDEAAQIVSDAAQQDIFGEWTEEAS